MKLRALKKTDIKAASQIIGKNYSKEYERKSFKELEAAFKNHAVKPQYIVAEEKGKIIGLAGYAESWMDYDIYTIFWVNVVADRQGEGIGMALIEKVIELIKKQNPKMILLSTDKPKLYRKKFGFRSIAKFDCDGYDLMSLQIKK